MKDINLYDPNAPDLFKFLAKRSKKKNFDKPAKGPTPFLWALPFNPKDFPEKWKDWWSGNAACLDCKTSYINVAYPSDRPAPVCPSCGGKMEFSKEQK